MQKHESEEVRDLARLAATNLLGYGYHKDGFLFDVLSAIRVAHEGNPAATISRLEKVAPIVRSVDEITDGDETKYLPGELAEVVFALAPDALPPYIRELQNEHEHWVVETFFTDLARTGPLTTPYEKALGTTWVHEEALVALNERAGAGDETAGGVLAAILAYLGRPAAPSRDSDSGSSSPGIRRDAEVAPPSIADYPPARVEDYARAVRDSGQYSDEPLADWTRHWRVEDPDGLLVALSNYLASYGYPFERQTGKDVVALALERSGRGAAWTWLVAFHEAMYGWSWHTYRLGDIDWIWKFVANEFAGRWLVTVHAGIS